MMDDETTETPRSILISSLAEEDRAALLRLGRDIEYGEREAIFGIGEPGDTLVILAQGRVEISVTSLSGRKSVLNHMGPGEVLGEIALLDGGARSADATAMTPVHGRVLHRREVLAFLRERPDAMLALIAELCGKIRNASEMFEMLSHIEAPARLARCLLRLGAKWGAENADGNVQLGNRFSQTDLGEFSGLSRESVNRHMKKWQESGLLRQEAGEITLLDLEGLEELALV